ncbi:MAG: repeat family protein [Acidobacteria bacterium]|nr:repeat family protein [Acidobacteriota bacterium]
MAIVWQRAIIAADDPAHFHGHLAASHPDLSLLTFVLPDPRTPGRRLALAATLDDLGSPLPGDASARAIGTASFLGDDFARAVSAFRSVRHRDARDWNNLAAAAIGAAGKSHDDERWLEALVAADRALALDPRMRQARFNRARALDGLGAIPLARAEWRRFLAADARSRWAWVARQRLRLREPTDAEAWKRATADLSTLSDSALSRLARSFPQQARTYAEGIYLSAWAEAMEGHDPAAARLHLERARAIGRTLREQSREPLLAEAVEAIDGADEQRLARLIEGHLAYRRGRMALAANDLQQGERELDHAQQALEAGRSAMSAEAGAFAASTVSNQNRSAEARVRLTRLLASERRSGGGRKAVIARIQHEIALCEAVRGHWSDSLAAAQEAFAIFAALRERGYAAASEAIVAEDYDYIGQEQLAWRHGFAALRGICTAGDFSRARVVLAALCRTAMRSKEWEIAPSVEALEAELAPAAPDPRLDADMFLRAAAIEAHVGKDRNALGAIDHARAAAARIPDPPTRAKLIADIDGAAGTLARRSDPHGGIELLSSAIVFQQNAVRPIVLPELYLERGRAHLALGSLPAAQQDFDDGIGELERQRSHLDDADLRPGIFDHAADLFDEAISLQIRRGAAPAVVLAYVERGRARAMLEQIAAHDAPDDALLAIPAVPRVADVQRRLAAGAILLEYVPLPDKLLIFVVTPKDIAMRSAPVPRTAVAAAVGAFTGALASRRDADGSTLAEMLLHPVAADLNGVGAINIVSDDTLQRVPFAALVEPSSGSFLIQRHVIAVTPSAGVFVRNMERFGARRPAPSPAVVIFANPTIPRDAFPSLPSLGASELEASVVARFYRSHAVFTADAASAKRFLSDAPTHEVVHFAGHAIVHQTEPASSLLVCASTAGVPGSLTMRQIARMRFDSTQVVVLAACSTMTGRNAAVEGVASIARSFMIAGVPAVVGTLWDIDDREAAPLMRSLHEQLARGASPAAALRAAQIAAIGSGRPPSEWAAFTIMGVAPPPPPRQRQ